MKNKKQTEEFNTTQDKTFELILQATDVYLALIDNPGDVHEYWQKIESPTVANIIKIASLMTKLHGQDIIW